MASCAYCGSSIFIGGKKVGEQRFCNGNCAQRGELLAASRQIPDAVVAKQVALVHDGACPLCRGAGPVDVHTSYEVWSALLLTRWSSKPQVSCRSCARKAKLKSTLFSGVLGWWGFPWGFIFTPIQILRNIAGMAGGPAPERPSPTLERFVRLAMVQHARNAGAAAG